MQRRGFKYFSSIVFAVCFALCITLSASALTISSCELRNLQNGDIIQKNIKGQALSSSKMIKGSESKILINAPAEKIWNILDDKENLPKIIHQIKEAQIIAENESHQKVKTSVKLCRLLPSFDYILSFDRSEKYRLMKFEKTGGCFNDLFGYFAFTPYGRSTILEYRIYSDPGFYIPEFICDGLKKDAKKFMIAIKDEAEK